MIEEVTVTVFVNADRQDAAQGHRAPEGREEISVSVELAVAIQVIRVLARLQARVGRPGRPLAARLYELGAEQRVRRISFLHEVPVARVAAADLERRRSTQARDDLVQERSVAEELEREVRSIDREHVQTELPPVCVDSANVGELHGAEAARRSVLPLIQGVPGRAIPVREFQTRAVVQDADLAPHLPFRRLLGLEVRVAEVTRCEPRSQLARQWGEGREFVEGPGLEPGLSN